VCILGKTQNEMQDVHFRENTKWNAQCVSGGKHKMKC